MPSASRYTILCSNGVIAMNLHPISSFMEGGERKPQATAKASKNSAWDQIPLASAGQAFQRGRELAERQLALGGSGRSRADRVGRLSLAPESKKSARKVEAEPRKADFEPVRKVEIEPLVPESESAARKVEDEVQVVPEPVRRVEIEPPARKVEAEPVARTVQAEVQVVPEPVIEQTLFRTRGDQMKLMETKEVIEDVISNIGGIKLADLTEVSEDELDNIPGGALAIDYSGLIPSGDSWPDILKKLRSVLPETFDTNLKTVLDGYVKFTPTEFELYGYSDEYKALEFHGHRGIKGVTYDVPFVGKIVSREVATQNAKHVPEGFEHSPNWTVIKLISPIKDIKKGLESTHIAVEHLKQLDDYTVISSSAESSFVQVKGCGDSNASKSSPPPYVVKDTPKPSCKKPITRALSDTKPGRCVSTASPEKESSFGQGLCFSDTHHEEEVRLVPEPVQRPPWNQDDVKKELITRHTSDTKPGRIASTEPLRKESSFVQGRGSAGDSPRSNAKDSSKPSCDVAVPVGFELVFAPLVLLARLNQWVQCSDIVAAPNPSEQVIITRKTSETKSGRCMSTEPVDQDSSFVQGGGSSDDGKASKTPISFILAPFDPFVLLSMAALERRTAPNPSQQVTVQEIEWRTANNPSEQVIITRKTSETKSGRCMSTEPSSFVQGCGSSGEGKGSKTAEIITTTCAVTAGALAIKSFGASLVLIPIGVFIGWLIG